MKGVNGLFILLVTALVFFIPAVSSTLAADVLSFAGKHVPLWHLKATNAHLIGGYGDNFSYDGSRVSPIVGDAEVALDAEKDTGNVVIKLYGTITPEKGKTYTGKIIIYFHPEKGGPAFKEGGVADFIYMHGDTKQGPPVMPKARTYLASWGTADVYVNGKLVYKGLDGHIMYTERIRDTFTQAIYNHDRTGYYSPKHPADSSIAAADETELHFVAHSHDKDPGNFPPNSVFIHLNFEQAQDVTNNCDSTCTCGCQKGLPCKCGLKR